MITAIILLVWAACGVLTYGMMLAYLQRRWPRQAEREYREDCSRAAFLALLGPAGLFVTFFMTAFAQYGFMYRRKGERA